MLYILNGEQCTFVEMLGAYIAESTAKEAHLLGMVVGILDRHVRKLDPTPVQCQTIMADTHGRIRFAGGNEARTDGSQADIGYTADLFPADTDS
jgi:hypothetical protein